MNFRERFSTNAKMDGLRKRLQSWAADPRTTIPQLRRALDELVEKGVAFEPDSFSLKRDYLEIMQLLDDPNGYLEHGQGDDLLYRFGDMQLPPDLAARVYAARRFLIREPDRSRRVLRLVFANWLAQSVIPPEQRPKPAVKVLTQVLVEKVALPIYPVSPEVPAGARVRSPRNRGMARKHSRCPARARIPATGIPSPRGTSNVSKPGRSPGQRTLPPRARGLSALRSCPRWHVPQALARRSLG